MLDILIKNANIITMNDALPVISGGCIGIENGKISFVSDKNSPEMQIAAERIIDADGNIVMPGLINTHAHTAMCIMRGYADDYALNDWLFKKIFPVEGRLTREAVLAGVRMSSPTPLIRDMAACVCMLMNPGTATLPVQSMVSTPEAGSWYSSECGVILLISPSAMVMSVCRPSEVIFLSRILSIIEYV